MIMYMLFMMGVITGFFIAALLHAGRDGIE